MSDKPNITITANAWTTAQDHPSIQAVHLRSYPALANCPQCKAVGFTKGQRSCNCVNCCCLYCCAPYWTCYMLYKWKDMNCCNMEHQCSSCGAHLASYSAC